MRYLLGRLFHQNKFPVKFIGTSLFFPWLLVFYYLTDAFVLVLFMSSTSHPHPRCRSSCSQMFFKIGVPKNFPNFPGKHRCFPVKFVKFLRKAFFTKHFRWLLLSILFFMNVSSFTSSLPNFHYFLTVLLLSSLEETLSSSYHYCYIIIVIVAEWFIRIAAAATTYCTAISMIVTRVSALMEFMLKRKKITYE